MLGLDLVVSPDAPARTRVIAGRGAVERLADLVADAPLALLVHDAALDGMPVLARAQAILGRSRALHVTRIEALEQAKRLASVESIWERWIEAGAGRDSVVVAVGGGLVSDVAGFAAACLHRGVPWIIVPTTTLGQADAALGGKTAVNSASGKNLIGAVHHPLAVPCDWDALDTLPADVFADGLAEVVKAAIVGDEALLEDVERAAPRLARGDADAAGPLLFRALAVKADVVSADAKERSRREILNFGHTVAHALEHATDHAVSHGRAVATGIVAEALLAERLGRLEAGVARRIARACEACGLPWRPPAPLDRASLVAAMRRDKKVRAGVVRVALPLALGRHDDSPGVAAEPSDLADLVGREP